MQSSRTDIQTHHGFVTVGGHEIFYREAGHFMAPAVLLLHGYPASSFMFRNLIPYLANCGYRAIALDHLGSGFSDTPTTREFDYTFDNLADLTQEFVSRLEIAEFAIYVHGVGEPIGWRVLLNQPSSVWAVMSQNANAHADGFIDTFWKPIWAWSRLRTLETESEVRKALTLEAIEWQYTHGVPDPSVVSPDTWTHDHALVSRPGSDLVQLQLMADYGNTVLGIPTSRQRSARPVSRC